MGKLRFMLASGLLQPKSASARSVNCTFRLPMPPKMGRTRPKMLSYGGFWTPMLRRKGNPVGNALGGSILRFGVGSAISETAMSYEDPEMMLKNLSARIIAIRDSL